MAQQESGVIMLRLLVLLSFTVPVAGFSQLHWKNVDTAFGPLPATMHVFRSADSLDDHPFVAYYVTVVLKDKGLLFTDHVGQAKRYTPSQYYQLEQFP